MKNDQYFPLEVNMQSNEKVACLTKKLGAKGFGIYILLLIELRKHNHYLCGEATLKVLAKRNQLTFKSVENVVNNFGLFEWVEHDDIMCISSPYLHRVMIPLEEYRRKRSIMAAKSVDKRERDGNGRFTSKEE